MGSNSRSAVGTLVERSTRLVLLLHLPDGHGAKNVEVAMCKAIATLPGELARSVTWDQGTEMATHASFTVKTGVPVYFCDPHSPWQRGSNENMNGRLRRYLPKDFKIDKISQQELDEIAIRANDTPRKCLGYFTPYEVISQHWKAFCRTSL